MKRVLFVVIVLLFASVSVCAQSNDPLEKESLKGLSGVYVFLNLSEDSPSLEKDGLTETQIRTDVEIRLRKAGIRVLTIEETKVVARRPALSVTLLASKSEALTKLLGENLYSFSIQVEFKQAATLYHSTDNKVFPVTTWSASAVGMTSKRNIRTIREGIGDYVDKFINDYLAVNPK
ncbi:MAG: hypothetical protein H7Z16_04065 [Pyrinomonadaceae bacterium]|nr:hypothetical protein [Pyrinomonadaceae bacterium]